MAEPTAAPVPTRELPPEIWKQILSNVDEPSLMICRLVNKCWRDLASEVLSESVSFWTTHFEDRIGRRLATHFSKPDDLTRFIKEMKEFPNPFPNGTIIFNPSDLSRKQQNDFQVKFWKLLKTFGDSILNLGYRSSSNLAYRHLPSILKLKNLKRLVIRGFNWKLYNLGGLDSLANLQVTEPEFPEKLTEHMIHGENGTIPLSYLFGGGQSTPKSVSSLEISNNLTGPSIDFTHHFCQLPNLKKLKVRYPTAEFLRQFQQFQPNCVASLKEVSLDFNFLTNSPNKVLNFVETFDLLDYHKESLELLNLKARFLSVALEATGLNTSLKYTKMKTLVLSYLDIEVWPPAIRELLEKLVNLQEFKLILPAPHRFKLTSRDWYEIVMSCWNHLPASVRVITVPNYGWKIKREETLQFNDDGEQVE